LEQRAPDTAYWFLVLGAALIQPDDGRTQRFACRIDADRSRTLSGESDAVKRPGIDTMLIPEQPAGIADAAPVQLGVLFRPARLLRKIRLNLNLLFRQDVAGQVENNRTHALRAHINRQ